MRMTKILLKALGVSEAEMDRLKMGVHHWVEVKNGAVVFFIAPDEKAHYMAFPVPSLEGKTMSEFWDAVGKLPKVQEIESVPVLDFDYRIQNS